MQHAALRVLSTGRKTKTRRKTLGDKFNIQNTALTTARKMGTLSKQWLPHSGVVQTP